MVGLMLVDGWLTQSVATPPDLNGGAYDTETDARTSDRNALPDLPNPYVPTDGGSLLPPADGGSRPAALLRTTVSEVDR